VIDAHNLSTAMLTSIAWLPVRRERYE